MNLRTRSHWIAAFYMADDAGLIDELVSVRCRVANLQRLLRGCDSERKSVAIGELFHYSREQARIVALSMAITGRRSWPRPSDWTRAA